MFTQAPKSGSLRNDDVCHERVLSERQAVANASSAFIKSPRSVAHPMNISIEHTLTTFGTASKGSCHEVNVGPYMVVAPPVAMKN